MGEHTQREEIAFHFDRYNKGTNIIVVRSIVPKLETIQESRLLWPIYKPFVDLRVEPSGIYTMHLFIFFWFNENIEPLKV